MNDSKRLLPLMTKVRVPMLSGEVVDGTIILYNDGQLTTPFFQVFHRYLLEVGFKKEVNNLFGGLARFIQEKIRTKPYIIYVAPCAERPLGLLLELAEDGFSTDQKAIDAEADKTEAELRYHALVLELDRRYIDVPYRDDTALLEAEKAKWDTGKLEGGLTYGDPITVLAKDGVFRFDGLVPVDLLPVLIIDFKQNRKLKPEIIVYSPEVARGIWDQRMKGEVMMDSIGYYPEVIDEGGTYFLAMNGQISINELEAVYSLYVSSLRLNALTGAVFNGSEAKAS